jgi:hypothetical protein
MSEISARALISAPPARTTNCSTTIFPCSGARKPVADRASIGSFHGDCASPTIDPSVDLMSKVQCPSGPCAV